MIDLSTICDITEEVRFEGRAATVMPVPDGLHDDVKKQIAEQYPDGLYAHQAKAIDSGLRGCNVCIATPTASGKTLSFISIALSRLLVARDNKTPEVVLALYPAKALLHDQKNKWREAIKNTDFRLAIIDGGVSMAERNKLLNDSNILLMTPDVFHAWMMKNLGDKEIRIWLDKLKVVILDEAHIYDGILGTNMSFLLRRLQAVCTISQFLASSATIGDPLGLLEILTGCKFELIGPEDDGASVPEKLVLLCRQSKRRVYTLLEELLKAWQSGQNGRFLIFADSRRRVEELSDIRKPGKNELEDEEVDINMDIEEMDTDSKSLEEKRVLPYRAGYEEDDRVMIQTALTNGSLLGVVSTSALELGIDIGEIELVVMLNTPPSIKSFWQRAGRAGRRSKGYTLIVDTDGRISNIGLYNYLRMEPEANWLYLDNEYLQYANALCAAEEQQQTPIEKYSTHAFDNLPGTFRELLDNEIIPTRSIPQDLYPLKQQAIDGPHLAFPLRSGIEKSYFVSCSQMMNQRLGMLTYSQLLREAYPGAIYRYFGMPYRVVKIKHSKGEIETRKIRGIGRTIPIVQTVVFPQFAEQVYYLKKSAEAFVVECHVQVSERVMGFNEIYAKNKKLVEYGPGNIYSQKPLMRYINTTGVCFYFPDSEKGREGMAWCIYKAFCVICSVQDRDVGFGNFFSKASPLGINEVRGFAVYDAAYGSLRLTKQIILKLDEILDEAIRIAREEKASNIAAGIESIKKQSSNFSSYQEEDGRIVSSLFDNDEGKEWVKVVKPNQKALLHDGQGHINEEVLILKYIYTPKGIIYTLESSRKGVVWQVIANMIFLIPGETGCEEYNINTGEVRDMP